MRDLDHFKRVNDLHGHAVGDPVLAGFSALMASQLLLTLLDTADKRLYLAKRQRNCVVAEDLAPLPERAVA